jgi:hypothetical protein
LNKLQWMPGGRRAGAVANALAEFLNRPQVVQ